MEAKSPPWMVKISTKTTIQKGVKAATSNRKRIRTRTRTATATYIKSKQYTK
jgi:hypothetical protein